METIGEDEELVVNNENPPEDEESDLDDIQLSYSADQEDFHLDKLQRSRAARKKKKIALKKIERQDKIKKTRDEEPPRYACPVKNCKWTGPFDLVLQMHIESCHSTKKESEKSKASRSYVPLKRYQGSSSFGAEKFPDPIPDYKRWDDTWKKQKSEHEVEQLKTRLEKL